MRAKGMLWCAACVASLATGSGAVAQVPVSEVEQYYTNPAVFTPVEPGAHSYATRFPSLAADGRKVAFARDGQEQIVVRNLDAASNEVVAAPGLRSNGRDFSLSVDGRVLAFASDALPGKGGTCGREVSLRNMLTGSRAGAGNASCLDRPSKPIIPQFAKPYGYASNVGFGGQPSPSNSYDLYFRFSPPFLGKGDDGQCLTCAQDPGDSGTLPVGTFSAQPISHVAHRENKNLWISPGGNRLGFVFSVVYASCPAGNPDCGESGLVIADVGDSGVAVRQTISLPQRNRFLDVHASADGNRFVFSSSAALLPEDQDSTLDVYLYELDSGQLRLLSAGLVGSASDPQISGNGRYALFSTDSVARIVPIPPDVQGTGCGFVFDPVTVTSSYQLVDLQDTTPRRAQVLTESREFTNECFAAIEPPREGAALDHSGTRLALTTRNAVAAGDSNDREDVYLAANHFARDLIFDHGFD